MSTQALKVSPLARNVAYFVAFQVAWFACVLAAARGVSYVGPVLVAALAACHLRIAPDPRREAWLLLAAAVAGTLADGWVARQGFIEFGNGFLLFGCPLWITAMWVNFALVMTGPLAWLHGRHVWAFLLGAVGGPLAYLGGQGLGALTLAQGWLIPVAVEFAVLTPLLLWLASREPRRA